MPTTTTYYADGAISEVYDTDTGMYTHYDVDGVTVLVHRPLRKTETDLLTALPAAQARAVNAATVRVRARNAVAANAAFLALTPPLTAAQVTQQVTALTRECTALIRLALDLLDDTAGT